MDMNEYQRAAHEFASYRDNLYPVLGLAEEAGELAGKIAKHLRAFGYINFDAPDAPHADAVRKELGDVLWMAAEIATLFGWDLDFVAFANLAKLNDRKARGVIEGEGDNR